MTEHPLHFTQDATEGTLIDVIKLIGTNSQIPHPHNYNHKNICDKNWTLLIITLLLIAKSGVAQLNRLIAA